VQSIINKGSYYYCEGFFVTVSPESLEYIANHSLQNNKYYLLNLSATYIVEQYWKYISELLPYTDVLFSNEKEALEVGKLMNWESDIAEIAIKIASIPMKSNQRNRTVIFTQGSNSTIVACGKKVYNYPTPFVPTSEIKDTNGAGDSFVGGFLSMFVQGKSIAECVAAGHYVAGDCIRHSGVTFSPKPTFNYKNHPMALPLCLSRRRCA